MTRQAIDLLHTSISDIVSARRESPLLTVAWVAEQAIRAIRTPAQRFAALREGAQAIARDVLMNSNPTRYCVSRFEEFQYVQVEHLTEGELVDLLARVRAEAIACAEAALDLQRHLMERRHFFPDIVERIGVLQ